MQQQQQQPGSYDLLAVFTDEEKADAASAKLRKEGFSLDEVFQLEEGMVGQGQFREHGPNQARSDYFLRTQKTGPKPIYIILFAVIFGVILGVLALVASFALPRILPEPTTLIVGALIGIILGASTGTFTRRRVRGAIGQDVTKQTASKEQPVRSSKGALNVVALRLPDSENISRKSRARAILLNSGGKIDRSVGRR
ncbi:hypothetical protein [Ktedonobacter robiniae]|uniref:DUF1707 domain-containing protein n=1 Tax=Ktedonobacter robiniae TaxID=2778365 RepID=A0ABQ3UIM5_9CHLR|nr:hypothetical protein [Ktedonobacter robiniae]GHO52561.1 hypothetical protein KSB_10360 [Ktedonobacter robiniae]